MTSKRIVSVGLASHVTLAAIAFMLAAGTLEFSLLERILAMAALAGWGLALGGLMGYTRHRWERAGRLRRAGLVALAAPGLTVGLPIAALYLFGSRNKDHSRPRVRRRDVRPSRDRAAGWSD